MRRTLAHAAAGLLVVLAALLAVPPAEAQNIAPTAPTNLTATAGDTEVALSWDAPDAAADITRHEYRYKTGTNDYPETWTVIPDSAPGGTNQAGVDVTGLTNGPLHTFQVRAVNGAGESPSSNEAGATPQPTLTIAVDPISFGEADGGATICVVPSAVSNQRITVQVATADGTATAPGDYGSHSGTVVALQPRQQRACFSVTLVDDTAAEGDETFTVTLSNPVNATLGTPAVATFTILASDPEVTIAAASTPVEEGGAAEFTLTRTAPLAADLTVNVTVSQTGAFIETADSYTPPTTVAFEADQATATLRVELDDDDVDEVNGAVTATVTASTANDYAVGASAEAVVAVQDNDTAGLVLSTTALPLTEGGAAGSYTVKLATQPSATVTVAVDGAAGTDLTVSGPPLRFTTSNWGTAQTVTVTAAQDADGTDDTVTLTHTASGGDYNGVTGDDVTVTVTDNDLVVSIRADSESVSEADGSATFTLTRTMDTATTLTVAVTVSGEGDYLGTPIPVEAVFNVGDRETTLTVPIDDDDLDEADGSVTVTLTAAADVRYEIGSEDEATVDVTDNDLPFVRFIPPTTSDRLLTEGDLLVFRMEREGDTSVSLVVDTNNVTSGFVIPSAGSHGVTHGEVTGFYSFLPGEASKEFRQAVFTFRGETLSYLGGRYQHWITPRPGRYRTEELTAAHRRNIESCSVNTNPAEGECLGFEKPYQQYFFESATQSVIIETGAATVTEGTGAAFTLRRLGGPATLQSEALVVDLEVTENGQFIEGAKPQTATIPARQASTTLVIPTKNDDEDEADGSITVRILPRTGDTYTSAEKYEIVPDDAPQERDFGENRGTVTVTDNDLPVISIAADADPVEEGDTVSFTLTRTELANEQVEVTVDFTATGNLLSGAASAVAAFAENSRTATVSIQTVEDDITEADGSLTATLRALTGYRVGDPAIVTVADDDLVIDLALSETRVSEDGGGRTVTVTATLASGARTEATAVALTVSGSGDPGAVDFAPVTPFTLTISANQTSGQATFRLTPENDSVDETDETVTVSGAVAALPALVVNPATLTLADDDVPSDAIALTVNPAAVSEGVGALGATVTVTATMNRGARAEATEIEVSVAGNTATAGTDFAAVNSFTLTIPADATSGQASFTLTPADDDIAEGAETIAVSGEEVVDAGQTPTPVALPVSGATLTLIDNDTASDAIALSLAPMEVAEDAGATEVTVTAALNAGARTTETEVAVTVAGGSAVAGADFTAVNSFTLTIPANAVSGRESFTLTPTDDGIAEGAETIAVSGAEVVDAGQTPTPVALPVSGATLTLTDNDTVSTAIALSVSRTQFAESDAAAEVTVTAELNDGSRTADTVLSVSVLGNTADAGDFTPVASFPLTIPASQDSGTATFTFTPVADRLEEGDETITVSGRVSSGPTLPVSSAEIALTDVFTASTEVTLTVRPTTVSENVGSGGQLVNVFAEMSDGARTVETVIRVTVSGSGAEGAVDFEPVQAFDLTIPANNTGGAATFSLKPIDNEVDETDETIAVSGAVAALPALTVNAATLTLTDDDTASDAIALSVSRTQFAESDAATEVTVTARLNGNARTSATAVEITVSGSGVASAVDFAPVGPFTLTIPPNLMSGQAIFTLTPVDDTADETDETITVAGAVPAPPALTVSSAEITLTDDDAAPSVSIGDASVGESDGPLVFGVTLSAASGKTVSVGYATAPGSGQDGAAAGTDFTTAAGTLTFPAGVASWDIEVPVLPDDLHEADETLAIEITIGAGSADDLTLGDAAAVGTIVDDDDEVQVSVANASAGEGDGSIVFTVTLSRAFSQEVQVDWSATGDTATAGVDYTVPATPTTLTFSPQETEKTITVSLMDDEQDEADETFHLDLSNPIGAVVIGTARATGTIVDDDVPTVTISPLTAEVTEGVPASFTVTRVNHRQIPLTVLVAVTQDGDFLDGAPPTDVSFPADRDSVTLEVQTDDDLTDEEDGSVTAMLRADAANYRLGTPSSATVTVKDDEEPAISVVMKLNSIVNVSAVAEDAGAIPITIEATTSLLRQPTRNIEFNIITSSDTAMSPADFRQLSEQISILATDFSLSTEGTHYTATQTRDNTAQDLILTIVDDVVDEGNEMFKIRVERGPGTASYVTLPPAETVITITDDDEVPGKPALSAAFGDMAATLNWTAPGDPGTSPIDGYDYRRSADGGTAWDPDWSEVPGGASAVSHTVESLANGTEYTFEVRARSAAGDGEASDPVTVTPATAPDAPTGLTAAGNGQTQIDLSWTAPARTGGAAIAGYFIESSPDGESTTWTGLVADTGSPATGYSDTGLAAGTTRHYRVSAINVAGTGMPSNTASATTEKPGVTVSETALTVTEGDAAGAGYTVVLGARPTATVTVSVSGASGTDLTVSPASLTFTTGDWEQPQTVTVTAAEDGDAVADEVVTLTHTARDGGYDGLTAQVAVTIAENDTASDSIALSVNPAEVSEGVGTTGATVTVTAMLNAAPRTTNTEVTISVAPGTASADDFTAVADFTLTIEALETSGEVAFTLIPVDDAVAEGDETVAVSGTVAQSSGLTVATPGATVTITDDDTASSSIALSVNPATVSEGVGVSGETVTVTAMLNAGARTTDTEVMVSVAAGTASADDFTAVTDFTLTIPARATSGEATFTLIPVNDDVAEGNETVTVSGTTTASGLTVATPVATVTITDDDKASSSIALSVNPAAVSEGVGVSGAVVTVTAMLNAGARTTDTEVMVSVSPGTASADDFAAVTDFTLTIEALATSGTAEFTLTPVNDDVAEGDETVTVSGTTTASGLTVATPLPTVTITDNDTASTRIDLSVSHARVAEDAGATVVMVTAMLNAGSRTADTVVTVSVEPGTADAGDFTPVASFPLTILATETSGEATFTLSPSADRLEEGDETLAVRGTVTGVPSLTVSPAVITLTDVFTASGAVTLSVAPATVSESVGSGGQLVNVTAELDGGARDAATVIQVSVAGSGAAGVVDFTPVASFTLTIPADHTGGAATFSLKPVDDEVDETDETIIVGGVVAGLTVIPATLMLTDDDTASDTIALSVNPATVSEGVGVSGETVTVTAMLNAGARTTDTEVTISVAPGTASADDFAAVTDFTLTIPAEATSGEATFTLIPVDDEVAEGNETVTVSGTVPQSSGLTVATPLPTVTIEDNDAASSSIALSVNPAAVSEGVGVSGTPVTVTAMLNAGARKTDTTVTVSVAAGTASADDFAAVTDFTLTIEALATSGAAEFTLIPVDDGVAEGNETVAVSGTTTASGLTVAAPGATVTITDNDAASDTIALSVNPAAVSEGVGASGAEVTVTAMLNAGARPTATEVTVSVAAGTASADDFAAVADFTLTIAALATSATAEFKLIPVDDDVAEGNETVAVSGTTTASGLTVAAPAAAVTITDNDTVTVSFAPAAVTAAEGDTASFTVTLSGEAASDVTLGYTTGGAGDTATSGDDYTAVTAGALTFLPEGALTQTLAVTTLQDTLAEASETFTVTLTGTTLPAGVTLGTATATGTITDDETLTAAVTGAATVAEGAKASFPVTLTGGTSTADVAVTYTVAGTATAGTDYTAPGGTLTIPAESASGTIEIQTAADDVLDASETLVVTLTGASTTKGTAAVNAAAATTTIADVGSLTVSKSALRVTEGDTTGAGYTVVLDSQPTAAVTVTVSGASGTDLTVSPASLTFATTNWDQPQTVTVTAAEDEDAVADDAVTLTHTARDGGYDGVTGDSVTVTIAEDDIVIPSNLVSVTADAPHGLYVYNGRKSYLREVPPGMYDDGPAPYVYEGEEATFTVTLSGGAATAAVEVSYEVGGEVTPGRRGDYTAPSGTLRIPRGSASGTIRIQTFLDVNGLTEFPERLEVTLTGATSGAVGVDPAGASAMMLLWEGKQRWVFVAETTVTEYPTAEWTTFNVSLSRRLPVDLAVHWRTRDGTARAGEDYEASTGTVILPAGTVSREDEVRLLNDDIAEDTETFKVELTGTNFPERVVELPEGGWDSADLTIRDDDRLRANAQGATGNPITGFTLFDNAGGGADVQALTEGAALAALSSERLDIRAEVASGAEIGSVRMEISGAATASRTDGIAPYALFGDQGGRAFPAGTYTVTATPYPEPELGGTPGPATSVTFTVAAGDDAAPSAAVTSAAEAPVSGEFQVTVRFSEPVTGFAMSDLAVANGRATGIASLTDGTEHIVAIVPDTGASGAVTVTVPAGVATDADGNPNTASAPFAIALPARNEADGPLTGFTLFDNANGGADVTALTDDAALAALSSERLNIRAEIRPGATVGSVRLELSGAAASSRTEGSAPYALFGDRGGQAFPAGAYRITATPYPERDLGGTPGPALSVAFTVRVGEVDAAEAGPAVTGAAVTSSPAGGGAYAPGEEIAVTVRFDAPVTVDTAGGTPTIGLRVGGKTRRAGYGGGSGTAALAFAYTVTADDDGAAAGIRVIGNSLSLNGGTIQGGAGADADTAFDVAPVVTGVAVSPDADGTWAAGEEIAVTVTFSETVTVDTANGRPSIGLALGDGARAAAYGDGSGTRALGFAYTVAAADGAIAAVRVAANSLSRNGGTIRGGSGLDAELAHGAASRGAPPAADDAGPALSVADVRAREGVDETIGFTVTLSPASEGTVTVDYETADGTATAFEDYVAVSGTLLFRPGDTEVTVLVDVLDDARDEGEETFTLRLGNASGASLGDAEATGTIANTDPLPQAWLARFGRTVAGHVVDAVGERLTEVSAPGSHVTVADRRLPLDAGSPGAAARPESPDGRLADTWPWDGRGRDGRLAEHSRTVTDRELLLGSSFLLSLGPEENGSAAAGARWTAWGRAAATRFDGRDGALSLSGDVTTGMLGVDGEWERWIAGVAVSHSAGDGSYDLSGVRGKLESSLTGVHPYARYEASERLSAWGVLGYGTGGLTHAGDGEAPIETDIGMTMGAIGVRGVLLAANDAGGFELAARSDLTLTRTWSEAATDLEAAEADTSRLRLILEGSRAIGVGAGGTLTPSLEVGLRHDGGDAETGTGVELGAGLRYADPARGLTMEVNGRTLIAHEERGYKEWGLSGSVRLDPGASGRGLSLTLSPAWGADSSGVERLWSLRDTAGLAANENFDATGRLDTEIGYGLAGPDGLGVVTPYAGLALSDGNARIWRLGSRWTLGAGLSLNLDGTRREAANNDAPEHSVELMFRMRVPIGAVAARSRAAPGRSSAAAEAMVVRPDLFGETLAPGPPGLAVPPPAGFFAAAALPAPPRDISEADIPPPERTIREVRSAGPRHPAGAAAKLTPAPLSAAAPMSVAAVSPAPPPETSREPSGGPRYLVQLGAFSRRASAVRARTVLAGELADLLAGGGHALTVDDSKKDGLSRVVLANAFAARKAAATLCTAIEARGKDCYVTRSWPAR